MQFDADTKATGHGSHLVTFDPRPETEIEHDAQADSNEPALWREPIDEHERGPGKAGGG